MKVAVIGAGAVGLGLGSCALAGGAAVHFHVRRDEARAALAGQGLERSGIFGEVHAAPGSFSVSTSLADLAEAAPAYVLVCTKTTATNAVAGSLAEAWPDFEAPPAVVLCQNGWGSAARFADRLPAEHVYSARVITGFRRTGWNAVEITVHAEPIRMGSLHGQDPALLAPLCGVITASGAGIPCEVSDAIEKDLWAKLLYNCALNPLAALRGVPYGAIGETAPSRGVLEAVVAEIFAVLEATAHQTHWRTADDYLEFFYRELLPPTRGHESSMLQDLRAGQRTEIDALCNAVVVLGTEADVPTPVNAALATLVSAIEG